MPESGGAPFYRGHPARPATGSTGTHGGQGRRSHVRLNLTRSRGCHESEYCGRPDLYHRPMPLTALKPVADLRDRLREATLSAHRQLDGLLAGGLADVATYHAYLRGMHRFISDAEAVLDEPPLRSLWLSADLVALELPPLPPCGRLQRATGAEERLGWRYVIAGSSMGARLLRRDAQRLGFTAQRGARFLDRHAIDGEWPAVLQQLAEAALPPAREALLVEGAHDAFAAAEAGLRRALLLDDVP